MTATMSFPGRIDDGFRRMVQISFAIHVAVIVLYIVFPRSWFETKPPVLMTISLGAGIGEKTSGTTAIGAREIEKAAPPPKRPEPAKPVTPAKPDVMKVPAKPAPEKKPAAEAKATPPPTTRPPVTGAQVQKGSTAVETGVTGQSPGITVGGGGGAFTVLVDFCCPEYANEFIAMINKNWTRTAPQPGETTITFTIYKDGTISDPIVSKSSGNTFLDIQSKNAVRATKKLPPLPAAYPNTSLTVHLVFPYVR